MRFYIKSIFILIALLSLLSCKKDLKDGLDLSFIPDAPSLPSLPGDSSEEEKSIAPPLVQSETTFMKEATSFIYSGDDPIQKGVEEGTIEEERVVVLKGKVLGRDNNPISGVKVTILNHAEYGETLTREKGEFDMAVNGGGVLTINYEKDGYFKIQRKVDTPWRDYVVAPDVVLIERDTKVTKILKTGTEIQVAESSTIKDESGTRQAKVLFTPGTEATAVLPDGTNKPLTDINVRVSEYTVGDSGPEAMPGEMPSNIAYTYAIEIAADEAESLDAKSLTLNKPVYYYLDNFLNVPVGSNVPHGYYDKEEAVWKAAKDGRVIKILSITDGKAALDLMGTGTEATAEIYTQFGVTEEEKIKIASLYPAGKILWRVPLQHFSPHDFNYPKKENSEKKKPSVKVAKDTSNESTSDQESLKCGSIIGCKNQTLGERINIVGAPFSLVYSSAHQAFKRDAYKVTIPFFEDPENKPQDLKGVRLSIHIAGKNHDFEYRENIPDSYTFKWDGLDSYGRKVVGSALASITISYIYELEYTTMNCSSDIDTWGQVPAECTNGSLPTVTRESEKSQLIEVLLGANFSSTNSSPWKFSINHFYDQKRKELYLGSGSTRRANPYTTILSKEFNLEDDYDDYKDSPLAPYGTIENLVRGPDGYYYFSNYYNQIVRFKDLKNLELFAGKGGEIEHISSGDGGPAIEADFELISNLIFGKDGNLYIIDSTAAGNMLRKIDSNGIINKVLTLPDIWDIQITADGYIYGKCGSYDICRINPNKELESISLTGNNDYKNTSGEMFTITVNTFRVKDDHKIIAYTGYSNFPSYTPISGALVEITSDGVVEKITGSYESHPDVSINNGESASSGYVGEIYNIYVAKDSSIYFSENYQNTEDPDNWFGYNRFCKITKDGKVRELVTNKDGESWEYFYEDNIPLTYYSVWTAHISPAGDIYVSDGAQYHKIDVGLPESFTENISIPSEDASKVFVFTPKGIHLRTLDALSGEVIYDFAYNDNNELISVIDKNGKVTEILRNSDGVVTEIKSPFGQVTKFIPNSIGYPEKIVMPISSEFYSFTYHDDENFTLEEGFLASFTNPRGFISLFEFNEKGKLVRDELAGISATSRLERVERENGYEVKFYSPENIITTHLLEFPGAGETLYTDTFPNGTQKVTFTSLEGVETTYPDGSFSFKSYAPDPQFKGAVSYPSIETHKTPGGLTSSKNKVKTVTLTDYLDPFSIESIFISNNINERYYSSEFTSLNMTWVSTSPENRISKTILNENFEVSSMEAPKVLPVSFAYNAIGKLDSVAQGNRSSSFIYNSEGFLDSSTNALGESTFYVYDLMGRVTKQILPDLREISFIYDENGNLTSITPPGRPAHSFEYNPFNLMGLYSPPTVQNGGSTEYLYNKDRKLTDILRPDGKDIKFNYSEITGQLDSILSPLGEKVFSYDLTSGQLKSVTTPEGNSISISYDGPLVTDVSMQGDVSAVYSVDYSNDFVVTASHINGGNTINFSHDMDLLLTSAGDLTLTRDYESGFLTGTSLGAISDTLTYNSYGELDSYSAPNLFSQSFERDLLGRITLKTETVGGTTKNYDYIYEENTGRLKQVKIDGVLSSTYTYNLNGGRYTKADSSGTKSATYDDQDRLLSYGDFTYTYNENGDLVSKTNTTNSETTGYTYDAFGNLRSVTMPDGTKIDYIIDAQNRRIGKKVNGTIVRAFIYKDQLNPIAELDAVGNVVSRFVYASKPNVPDYMIKGGVKYRIISDHLGSPRLIVNTSDGSIVQEMEYSEFGEVIKDTNPSFQPFGFAGGIYDTHTKLVRFGARDYDPYTGRWTAKDPIKFDGGDLNLYGYVLNDPINYDDPEGLKYRRCRRPLDGLDNTYGPLYHEYIDFDKGKDYSFVPSGSIIKSDAFNKVENGDGSSCSAWSKDSKNDAAIRKKAEKKLKNKYMFFKYNCQDYVNDVLEGY